MKRRSPCWQSVINAKTTTTDGWRERPPYNPHMSMNPSYQQQTRDLIDGLKAVCASNGLGNDGNE